jgi:hypothetical protein
VFAYCRVLVDLVSEQCALELILNELVLDKYPVVSNCADKDGHHHRILAHLVEVVVLEQLKSKIVGCNNEFNSLFSGEFIGGDSAWLLHADTEVEKFHRHVGVVHELLLSLFENNLGDGKLFEHNGGRFFVGSLLIGNVLLE